MYEYVAKTELRILRNHIEIILKTMQKELKDDFTFQFVLVGAANYGLLTKEVFGNKGFDLDYNIIVQENSSKLSPKEISEMIYILFNKKSKNFNFKKVTKQSSSISMIINDKHELNLEHTCDFAIIKEEYDEENKYFQEIIIYDKPTDTYAWVARSSGTDNDIKVEQLKYSGFWEELRDEYLMIIANNKDRSKRQYQLFTDAINEVYDRNIG